MTTTVQLPGFIHISNNYRGKNNISAYVALARLGRFKIKEKKKEKLNTDITVEVELMLKLIPKG